MAWLRWLPVVLLFVFVSGAAAFAAWAAQEGDWVVFGLAAALLAWFGFIGRGVIASVPALAPKRAPKPPAPLSISPEGLAELRRLRGVLIDHRLLSATERPADDLDRLATHDAWDADLQGLLSILRLREEEGHALEALHLHVDHVEHEPAYYVRYADWLQRQAPGFEPGPAEATVTDDVLTLRLGPHVLTGAWRHKHRSVAVLDGLAALLAREAPGRVLAVAYEDMASAEAVLDTARLAALNDDLGEAGRFHPVSPDAGGGSR